MAKKKMNNPTIEQFLKEMEEKFGPRALYEFGDDVAPVESIPTGILSLDLITGVGGWPRGRIIEIYGQEGSGKTAIALTAIAEAQRRAGQKPRRTYDASGAEIRPLTGRCGFIDVEHAFDPSFARMLGVNISKGSGFHFTQPNSGAEAMQMAEYMINSNLFDIIVIDSVAGLTTLDELEKDIGDKTIAGTAQLMSESLRRLVSMVNRSRTILIFLNQTREKPAVQYGSPETTPGGKAMKFFASMRLRVSKGEAIYDGSLQIGHKVKMKMVKNKVAPPYLSTEVDLYYQPSEKKGKDVGFDKFSDLLKVAQDIGVVELRGSQYRYTDKETGEVHKANGQVAWKEYLKERPELIEKIRDEVLNGGMVYGEYGDEKAKQEQSTEGQDF